MIYVVLCHCLCVCVVVGVVVGVSLSLALPLSVCVCVCVIDEIGRSNSLFEGIEKKLWVEIQIPLTIDFAGYLAQPGREIISTNASFFIFLIDMVQSIFYSQQKLQFIFSKNRHSTSRSPDEKIALKGKKVEQE